MSRTEHFNILKARVDSLGRAVFGDSLQYEVTVPVEDTHCDATITFDHAISVSVYERTEDEPDVPIFYWGALSHYAGNREEPPSEDFDEKGNANDTGYGLDLMLREVFKAVVDVRFMQKLDADADAAEAQALAEEP